MSIVIEVKGLDSMIAKLERAGRDSKAIIGTAMYLEAESIMATSKEEYVPVVTGALRASGVVVPPVVDGENITVVLGYGGPAAPYARAVHENPRAGKTGGVSPSGARYKRWSRVGSYKFLALPLQRAMYGMTQRLGRTIQHWSK